MIKIDAVFTVADGMSPDIAARLAQHADRYKANLKLEYEGKCICLDSLIGILSLAFNRGTKIAVIADGEDERQAAEDIQRVLNGEN